MVCSEYASNGYIVFALDHLDGSCCYTTLKDGTPRHFDQSLPLPQELPWEEFSRRLLHREEECRLLMDEISSKDFALEVLGFSNVVKIDPNFIIGGHSFGGGTALKVGDSDPRVKAVLTMDPWMLPLKKLVEAKLLKNLTEKPLFVLNSSSFNPGITHYDHKALQDTLFTENEKTDNLENILLINNSTHQHQTDLIAIMPFELELLGQMNPKDGPRIPRTYLPQLHQLMVWLQLDFLHKSGTGNKQCNIVNVKNLISLWEERNYI